MNSCGGCRYFRRHSQWSERGRCVAPVPEWAVREIERWQPEVADTDGDGCDAWQAKEEHPA